MADVSSFSGVSGVTDSAGIGPGDDRDRLNRRISNMKRERTSFEPHWKLLSEWTRPRRGRFEVTDRNRGERRHQNIINSTAIKASGTATAGMFNGVMSPSRPWFVLEDPNDPELSNFEPVRTWFNLVRDRMLRVFSGSNLYNMAPIMILEQLVFGTGCMSHVDDPEKVARFFTHTVGSYVIAQDDRMVVNTVGREFQMTVEQVVRRFSQGDRVTKNISPHVRNMWDQGNVDAWVDVRQMVDENPNFRPTSSLSRNFRWRSVYWEPGSPDRRAMLEEKGFNEFPFYCPRWEVTGEDVYGTNCPGMVALGDVRQLQHQERRKAQAIDKMVTPVMQGPPQLAQARVQHTPGFGVYFDASGDQKGFRPAYEVNLPIQHLTMDQERVERRINEAFFVDLFKAISAMRGVQPRNELELIQRDQERLLELGPVLERMFGDLLEPLVDRTFLQMARTPGLLPPPPQELLGRELKPRFVSILALAQQAAITGSLDRIITVLERLQPLKPEVADKFNADAAIEEYSRVIGTPPKVIVDDEVVAKVRRQRAEEQARAQQMQEAQVAASTAKTAADAKLEDDNLLSRVGEAAGL